ncbi:MAG: hypothetical protein Q8L73_06115 [Methylotenera sp.]|nr:hypothetical protein [Methylotenera sp.]
MKSFFKVSIIGLFISLTACATAEPKPSDIQSASYGPKPSKEYMVSAVENYMSKRLIDPSSATYECTNPKKSWLVGGVGSEGNVNHGQVYYGYYSVCMINAKNKFGGYTGAKENHFMIYQHNGSPALGHFDGFESGGPVPE